MYLNEGQYFDVESDASLLVQLGELKTQYRQRSEALCNIKAEVNYCEHLVDQCRVRLFSGQFFTKTLVTAAFLHSIGIKKIKKLN